MDFLSSLDRALFLFINQGLASVAGDLLWPLITDYDKQLTVRIVLLLTWLWLLFRGGRKGRTAALLIIPLIVITDKLNSEVLKELFSRPRPCHVVDGQPIIEGVRLLVHCGPGNSFPSSHAVNNFAVAFVFARFYPRWRWAFFGWAALVALSRTFVGVHYPFDLVGGAGVGIAIALIVLAGWEWIEKRFFATGRHIHHQAGSGSDG